MENSGFQSNALADAISCGFEIVKEYGGDNEYYSVKMLRTRPGENAVFLVLKRRYDTWIDMYGLMKVEEANERFRDCVMDKDIANAMIWSAAHDCTVWVASNGKELIWSDSRTQVDRNGFWICQIFEGGHVAEA